MAMLMIVNTSRLLVNGFQCTRTPASAHSFTLANDDTSVARRDWSRVRATRKLSGYATLDEATGRPS